MYSGCTVCVSVECVYSVYKCTVGVLAGHWKIIIKVDSYIRREIS